MNTQQFGEKLFLISFVLQYLKNGQLLDKTCKTPKLVSCYDFLQNPISHFLR